MSERSWGGMASSIVRTEMTRRRKSYADLAVALAKLDVEESEKNLRNKVMRGTFSAGFFLVCLKALGVESVVVNDWSRFTHSDPDGRRFALTTLRAAAGHDRPSLVYDFMGFVRQWRYSQERMQKLLAEGRIFQSRPDAEPRLKVYQDEAPTEPATHNRSSLE